MVVSLRRVQSDDFLTKFDSLDASLIPSRDFVRNFGDVSDYVEAHIYSSNYKLLYSNQAYTGYSYPANTQIGGTTTTVNNLIFDPVKDLEKLGYLNGLYTISYNIFRKKVYVSNTKPFFIKEISKDRKELRLASTTITNVDIESGVLNFINEMQNSPYYKDFLLNFGNNDIVNAVNIALDKSSENFTILVKLYQPLDSKFNQKDSLWIVEELSESHTFEIELTPDTVTEAVPTIRSANFNIEFGKEDNITSDYFNISDLLSNSSLTAYQKLLNVISSKQVQINVDYTNYSNFVHFSSAKERLLNFVYKLKLIETYQSDIDTLKTVSNYSSSTPVSSSIVNIQDKINKIIEKFDGYEHHLYYDSGSTSWPKSNLVPPYTLYSTVSENAYTWLGSEEYTSRYYGGQIYSASIFDLENSNNLNFSTPEFINLDTSNESYQLFLNMIGQHFDNIWIYIKAISDIYDGRNSMEKGVSRDLIYHVLKGLGISLYNSSANDDIFDYLLGASNSGSYAPVSESYQTLITASSQNLSGLDYNTEIYKRLYHNVSYLLKTKGTSRGIKALISTYGIPSTILDVVDYGGSDKNSNTIEYSYDRFTYSLLNSGSSYFKLNWAPLTDNVVKYGSFNTVADAIEIRFKPDADNIKSKELLFAVAKSGSVQDTKFAVWMDYTSSNGIPSAIVNFALSGSSGFKSSSLVAPVYMTGSDNDSKWWNLLLKRQYSRNSNQNNYEQTYYLYVKNKIGDAIGHQYSSSIYFSGSVSSSYNDAWTNFGTTSSMHYMYVGGVNYTSSLFDGSNSFIGNLQELRLWSEPISEAVFNNHVLNPESIQGNAINSAYDSLAARFTLGNNLVTYNHYLSQSVTSTHPNYNLYYSSGSYTGASLYGSALYGYGIYGNSGSTNYVLSINSASFHNFPNQNNYSYFTEEYNAVSPNAGYYNPVNHKIRISSETGFSAVLSPDISFEEPAYVTKDVHFTDVSFSPQNEIDKDIIAHFGNTLNLDDYIGDVRQETSSSYTSLDTLKKTYYKKFVSKYNYQDFIKLIKYFDGSLFKMIKDFAPVRTNIQTGITIKSPLLERNKVKRYHPSIQNDYNFYTASLLDVSLTSPYERISGVGDRRDFYTGELTGSLLDVNLQFNKKNYNPYARYTSSLDTVKFSKSNFNVLYCNVTESVVSSYIKYEDKPTNNITYPARVQDFYYKYKRHANPRYEGSRLNSSRLNYYTIGDDSYDKSSNVNSNVGKFAWINKIAEQNLNFYDKTSVNIKYLIDASSSLYELNLDNKNIFEVQNTFKSGDVLVLSLFDPYNPTVQLDLNGSKRIWQGGFSFSPVLYRESNENLLFHYVRPTSTYTSPIGVRSVFRSVTKWYNNDNNDYTFATYLNVAWPYPDFTIDGLKQGGKFSLSSGPYSSWLYSAYVPKTFSGILTNGYNGYTNYSSDWFLNWYNLDFFLPIKTGSADTGYNTSGFESSMTLVQNSYEKYTMFTSPKDTTYTVNISFPFEFTANHVDNGPGEFQVVGFLEKSVAGGPWQVVDNKKTTFEIISIPVTDTVAYNAEQSMIWYDPASTVFSPSLKVNCVLRNVSVALSTGDKLRVKFFFIDKRTSFQGSPNFTFTMMQGNANYGYFEVVDAVNTISTPITDYTIYGSTNLFTGSSSNPKKLTFLHSASIGYGNVIFSPSSSSTGSYSNILSAFEIKQGDLIRFGNFQTLNASYYTVDYVVPPVIYYDTNNKPTCSAFLEVYTKEDMSLNNISSNSFAILRKSPDETSIILNYTKNDGATSKGIAIPDNLKDDVKKQIANILKPIKDNLLLGSG